MGGEENIDSVGKEFGNARNEKKRKRLRECFSSSKNKWANDADLEYKCRTDLFISLVCK